MKRIRALSVLFDNVIQPYEVEAFRGAVIIKSGLENYLYHHHLPGGKLLYRYPLIQYKSLKGHPMLFCIDAGVDEAHHFFSNSNRTITISGREIELKIQHLNLKQYTLQVWDKLFSYRAQNWIALNSTNYKTYRQLQVEEDRTAMLEKILTGNILSFAKGVNWTIDKPILVKIDKIQNVKPITFKQQRLMAFSILFHSNVFLPDYLGLGKGVSHGMGIIKHMRNELQV